MTRKTIHDQSIIESARNNISKTTVIAVTVSDYSSLRNLPGAGKDATFLEEIFVSHPLISVYKNSYISLRNPTAEVFRSELLKYANSRSARGDILILYFSGHGIISGANDFGFCLQDTLRHDEGSIYSLSVVAFRDIVQTLAVVDVYPIFIIDACFSSSPGRLDQFSDSMMDDLHRFLPGSYGLLASSSMDSTTFDTEFGGVFTRTFYSTLINGLQDEIGKRYPILTLNLILRQLRNNLEMNGHPLSRYYSGPDLPEIPLCKNKKYMPEKVTFSQYMLDLLVNIWNGGAPYKITTEEILLLSRGAYGNHSKLSYSPWRLLEDDGNNNCRKLTEKGIAFMQGKIAIPKVILKDPIANEWIPAPNSKEVTYLKG